MRTFKQLLLVAAVVILPFAVHAQAGMEDVIYLNNGSIYRGIIIEQVPNVSMKIQTLGGNVFAVQMSEVTKITKEKKEGYSSADESQCGHSGWGALEKGHHRLCAT
jgi:hypothetical protein